MEAAWCTRSSTSIPETSVQHIQRAWDARIMNSILHAITNSAVTVKHARPKAASASHPGNWLHISPIAFLGLKLTENEVRISAALRREQSLFTPQLYVR